MEKLRVASCELQEKRAAAIPAQRPRRYSLATRNSRLATSPAFTLVELLVVIGIIGIVVALGVPLFGVLTGSRSQEAGQNLVAAAIGQARTTAVNEGKYAGVLFYVDPATDRTAMSVVIIADPASGLEDPDPYDKYKTWTYGVGVRYVTSGYDPTTGAPIRGDRVIALASDASATFRSNQSSLPSSNVYDPTVPVYSRLSQYMPNYKPTVRAYRARQNSTAAGDAFNSGRPPRTGPFYANAVPVGTGNSLPARQYRGVIPVPPPTGATVPGGVNVEGTDAPFANDNWGPDGQQIVPYATGGEQQLLPIGVGVQLIIQPTARPDTPTFNERYVRTGLIMFDPQGRLTLDNRALGKSGTLGKYLGLSTDANLIPSGVGVVFFDNVAFKADPARTQADWLTQVNLPPTYPTANQTAPINSLQPAFTDNATATATANEIAEEQWLDANTTPLLINRFSGALSEGQ